MAAKNVPATEKMIGTHPTNIITAKVEIIGTRALFFHSAGPETIPLEKQEMTGVAGNDPWTWIKTTPITAQGQLFLDPSYIFATIRDGAKHIKVKRGSLMPLVVATLQLTDTIVLIDRFLPDIAAEFVLSKGKVGHPLEVLTQDPTEPVYLDIRKGKNPNTKSAMIIYRVACSPGWHASFELEWDKTVVSTAQMEAALRDAGALEGLGSGRKIGKGRFTHTSFQLQETD
jgi:hypothetical protein